MAAVTQLFYVNNWLHDWWYDSGFNEAAGNAQHNNYGRGGLGGDVDPRRGAGRRRRRHAQQRQHGDARATAPRRACRCSCGPAISRRSLTITPPATSLAVGTAALRPHQLRRSPASVVLADDGDGADVTDGCEPLVNDVAGKIALVDRGTCAFAHKAQNAAGRRRASA